MRLEDVPQDDSILEGHRRACYAQDASGRYVIGTSRGWDVERIANQVSIGAINARVAAALADVRAGRTSVIAYHMARCHMDARLVAAHTGLWTFQVRRHLRPAVFAKLKPAILERYARAFGVTLDALSGVPSD